MITVDIRKGSQFTPLTTNNNKGDLRSLLITVIVLMVWNTDEKLHSFNECKNSQQPASSGKARGLSWPLEFQVHSIRSAASSQALSKLRFLDNICVESVWATLIIFYYLHIYLTSQFVSV